MMSEKKREGLWEWHEQPGQVRCPWCGTPTQIKGYAERKLGTCQRCRTVNYEREWSVSCPVCGVRYAIVRIAEEPL